MSIFLNQKSVDFIAEQIRSGNIVTSDQNQWHNLNPNTAAVDEYLKTHSYQDFSLWHLGLRPEDNPHTRAAYAFPVGDFKQVYSAGLKAAHERAKEYGYQDIAQSASDLLALIGTK